ncbi:MAG: PAS domain S-box protein, partial [Candidatus Hermodarchaeota archaeon]
MSIRSFQTYRKPKAFQFPEITCVKISFKDKEYQTIDYMGTKWSLSSNERINGDILSLEVYYKEDRSFLEEEITFLNEVARKIKNYLEFNKIKENLKREKKISEDLVNITSDTIFVFEPETGKAIKWNDPFRDISGYSDEEISSLKAPNSYYSEKDLKKAAEATKKVFDEGKSTIEMSLRTKNGDVIPFEYRARPFRTKDGKNLIVAYGRDITERQKAEQKLRESEQKYRYLFEHSPNAVVLMDLKGKFIEFNSMVEKLFGYTQEDLIGKNFVRKGVIHPDYLPKAIELYKEVTIGSGFAKAEYLYYKKDGNLIWGLTQGSRIKLGDQTYVQTIIQDITERKRTELALEKEKNLYRDTINGLPGVFYLFNQQGEFKIWNENFEKFSGYSSNEFKTLKPTDFFDESEKQKISDKIQEILITGKADVEAKLLSKNKSLTPYYWYGNRIMIDDDLHIVGYGVDLTERKKAEMKLKESEEKYKLITENVNDLITIVNKNFIYEYINEMIHKKQRGMSNEDLIGISALKILHPEDIDRAIKAFKDALELGEAIVELRVRNVRGGFDWFDVKGKSFIDVDRNKKVLIIARDITEKKEAELKLKESEEKYRYLFEDTPFAIALLDFNGNFLECNSYVQKIFGFKKED